MEKNSLDTFEPIPKVKRRNRLPENPESGDPKKAVGPGRFPTWLHRTLPRGGQLARTQKILETNRLHTVCEEAKCPNLFECWSKKTATYLAMGKACTRSCPFCDIDFAKSPKPLDPEEPARIADSALELNLKHIVITQVARDDLEDGGANHLVQIIDEIRKKIPDATIELLTSDFFGNKESLNQILKAGPEVFNHNIETVKELTYRVRHKATYERTLDVLSYVKKNKSSKIILKSGLMVGLGETSTEVKQTIKDLSQAGCDIITIGQYLQASRLKLKVKEFIHPDQFKEYEDYGTSIGVKYMFCGPFVRSSYNASLVFQKAK